MCEQYTSHLGGEHLAAEEAGRHGRIDWVRVEKGHLFLHGCLDTDLILDVLLRSVLDADKAQTQRNLLIHDHAPGVSASVHDIDLGDHTDGPDALGVNIARHAKTFLRGHISVGWHDTKNDRSRVTHISFGHLASNLLDVLRLAWDWHKSDTWQIDESQVGASVRVDVQDDGVVDDVRGRAAHFICEADNRVSHLLEVGELLASELL